MFHNKLKHIEIKFHYIRDMVQRKAVKLQYMETNKQIADVLTKPIARVKFEYFRERLGVIQNDPSKEGVMNSIIYGEIGRMSLKS